jgi:hypothetical protein
MLNIIHRLKMECGKKNKKKTGSRQEENCFRLTPKGVLTAHTDGCTCSTTQQYGMHVEGTGGRVGGRGSVVRLLEHWQLKPVTSQWLPGSSPHSFFSLCIVFNILYSTVFNYHNTLQLAFSARWLTINKM